MLPPNLFLTSLQAAVLRLASAPEAGKNYSIMNLGTGDCLRGIQIGGRIPAIEDQCTETPDRAWLHLDHPPSDQHTPITLQVQSAPKIDDRGGYLRLRDTSSNLVEAGGAPQAWKLIQAGEEVYAYKIMPFDDDISRNGTFIASGVGLNDPPNDQVQLHEDEGRVDQLWVFQPLPAPSLS